MTKKLIKNPVQVSKRFLNEKKDTGVIKEAILNLGSLIVNINRNSLINQSVLSAESLPFYNSDINDDNFSVKESSLQSLRAAMAFRALLSSKSETSSYGSFGSIGENIATILLNGKNTNSSTLGGDNTYFADVVGADNGYYSVKMKDPAGTRGKSAPFTAKTLKRTIQDFGTGTPKKLNAGVLLIDIQDDKLKIYKKGPYEVSDDDIVEKNGFHLRPRNANQRNQIDLEKPKVTRGGPWEGREKASGTAPQWNNPNNLLSNFFYEDKGNFTEYEIAIASADEINASIQKISKKWKLISEKIEKSGLTRKHPDYEYNLSNLKGNTITQEDLDNEKILRFCRNFSLDKKVDNNIDLMDEFRVLVSSGTTPISKVIDSFPFFGSGIGAVSARSQSFLDDAVQFLEDEPSLARRQFVYYVSSLYRQMGEMLRSMSKTKLSDQALNTVTNQVKKFKTDLGRFGRAQQLIGIYQDFDESDEVIKEEYKKLRETVESFKNYLEDYLLKEDKKLKNGCIPARRRIASGGKAGSYADPRTGGKQAYAALKKAKPPGSKGGWTKKKCICCHKCPNDRSAPNGYVCTNPSHLYWGTKADNTYDQNRGNGWAARNKNEMEGDPDGKKAFAHELMISESKIRKMISKILLEDAESEAYFGKKFVDFKKAISAGEEPLEAAKRLLNEIGRGSTRIVFEFPDNPEIVLKIINTEVTPATQNFIDPEGNVMPNVSDEGDLRTRHGFFRKHMRQSNEWEADLVMQQKFPDVFPKTFEVADDFSWILAEKALPVATLDKLISELGVTDNFSKIPSVKKREFLRMIFDGIRRIEDRLKGAPRQQTLSEGPLSTILGIDDIGSSNETMPDIFSTQIEDNEQQVSSPSDTEIFDRPETYQRVVTPEKKRVDELVNSEHNKEILRAMVNLKIPWREFLPKNMGISEITGKLLIIDASLWNEKKKVE